ncbi:MAG: hypothetical protein HRT53_18195 [Colwellia sp.]|nr:hypothetical protein [Colwellia sp.]
MKTMSNLLKLFLFVLSSQCVAGTLTYKEVSTNKYELILHNEVPLEITQAQQAIYESAVQICNRKIPLYGKYKFESKGPISDARETSSFTFVQNITCTDEKQNNTVKSKFELTEKQEGAIKKRVNEMTNKFMQSKELGDFQIAYDMMTPSNKKISNFSSWKQRQSEFFNNSGKLINRNIWRLTIYNNPDNSPEPGIYIAADYESNYELSPIYCGYVMWYTPNRNSKEYKVMREEFGNINSDMIKNIKPEDLQKVRKKIGCRAI